MATSTYDLSRKRASQQYESDKQSQSDALKRRYAAMGNLNSGSMLKQQEIASENASKRLADAEEGITAAEAAENERKAEVQASRDFAASEAEKSRAFTSGEAESLRKWQTGERLSSQDFVNLQRMESQKFQTGEREGSQKFAADQSQLQRDMLEEQFTQSLAWDKIYKGQMLDLEKLKQLIAQDEHDFNKALAWATYDSEYRDFSDPLTNYYKDPGSTTSTYSTTNQASKIPLANTSYYPGSR